MYLSSAPASSSQTTYTASTCVHTQLLYPTQHTKYYPLPSDLETALETPFSWAGLGKKCACTIPVDGELAWRFYVHTKLLSALFCPATAAVCLGKTFWDSKLTAWLRLRHTALADLHHRAPTRRQMRACENTVRCPVWQTNVPSRSHRYDVPELEFKKKTPILASLGDFCLSSLRRVFSGFCKLQVILDAPSPRCPSAPQTEIYSIMLAVNGVTLHKRRPKAPTDDHPSTRKLLFSFSFR